MATLNKTKQSKPAKQAKYKVVLDTADTIYKGDGETVNECLEKIGLKWNNLKLKGVLKVKMGSKEIEQLFFLGQLKRIFGNKLTRAMWSKRLEMLIENK